MLILSRSRRLIPRRACMFMGLKVAIKKFTQLRRYLLQPSLLSRRRHQHHHHHLRQNRRPLKPQVLVHIPGMPPEETPLIDLEQEADLNISKSLKPGQLPREALECLNPRKRTTYFFAPKEDD